MLHKATQFHSEDPLALAILKNDTGSTLSDFKEHVTYPPQFYTFSFNMHIQWGKKVFSQPPIVQVLHLKKMREACNFHHRYTSTMRDKIRKENPENHIVGFLKNLFANYGGK